MEVFKGYFRGSIQMVFSWKYSKGIFGNHLAAIGCQNAKICEIVQIWKKLKHASFFS